MWEGACPPIAPVKSPHNLAPPQIGYALGTETQLRQHFITVRAHGGANVPGRGQPFRNPQRAGNRGLARATPDGFEPLADVPVMGGRCWTSPSLADGRLYLRDESEAVCLDLYGAAD